MGRGAGGNGCRLSPPLTRTYLESTDASDWQPNIDQFVEQGCQHIVTVGFALGEVTAINAAANPDIIFTMIDNVLTDENFAPLALPNVRELVYQTDEAAFAAGYLAAGMSQTGILCTYGGANFPTVSIFMDGFTRGAAYYNEVKGTDIERQGLGCRSSGRPVHRQFHRHGPGSLHCE